MKRMECSYPDLFDPLTLKCDSHDKVTCEPGQIVPKNQCKYMTHKLPKCFTGFQEKDALRQLFFDYVVLVQLLGFTFK